MRVNVADIKAEAGNHKKVPVEVAIQSIEDGGQVARFDKPFTGTAEIWNLGDSLLVQAELAGEVELQCSRCLSSFRTSLEVTVDEAFVEGEPGGDPEEDEEAERPISYYQGDEIDLAPSVRDSVLLALPMKPLCDEACEGLCPQCGANRNEGACDCTDMTDVDPRFAALKDLLRKPDSQS